MAWPQPEVRGRRKPEPRRIKGVIARKVPLTRRPWGSSISDMNGVLHLWIGAVLFFGGHAVLSSPGRLRPVLAARLGQRGFTMLYSTLAFLGLAWLIYGYAVAPRQRWWSGPNFAIVPAILDGARLASARRRIHAEEPDRNRPRGHSICGGCARDPADHAPSIPVGGRALAGGPSRGQWQFALAGVVRRHARPGAIGDARHRPQVAERDPANWRDFAARTSNIPFAAILERRNCLVWSEIGWGRVGAAVALYVSLFWPTDM